ncbi:hypothetical protein FHR22_000358 [Sphingopyxis panaciterrae]|nr:hypothetical protein [Sphingopyxis panaciterrae]NIJ35709.1 hypothetical protein [Sphingopyxis panaciterrae]
MVGFLQHQVAGGAVGAGDVKIDDADGFARTQADKKVVALPLEISDVGAAQLQPDDAGAVQIDGV